MLCLGPVPHTLKLGHWLSIVQYRAGDLTDWLVEDLLHPAPLPTVHTDGSEKRQSSRDRGANSVPVL